LEQIQFLLGHVSVQTTERYLGCMQRIFGQPCTIASVSSRVRKPLSGSGRIADQPPRVAGSAATSCAGYNCAHIALTSSLKIGPYEIPSPLGAGGMGEVYRACVTRLDRTVAIKVLPVHLSDNPEAKQRFDREALAISSLNHSNICTLYDVDTRTGRTISSWVEGETLADRLRKGALPLQPVVSNGNLELRNSPKQRCNRNLTL
jgi:serine/threonine protein kinase